MSREEPSVQQGLTALKAEEQVRFSEAAGSAVVTGSGHLAPPAAQRLASTIDRLDAERYAQITVDLRGALSLDPVAAHALFRAWERRGHAPDSVRVLVVPGPVQRFLGMLGLEHALQIVSAEGGDQQIPVLEPEAWRQAREGAVEHYHQMLAAARARDLAKFAAAAAEAHPICVASGAEPHGSAFGDWCGRCPLRAEYGGCQPLMAQATRAAEHGNWDAAQLLVMALIAEVAGMPDE